MPELEFMEACYEQGVADAAWGMRLAERMGRVVPEAIGVMATPYRIEPAGVRYLRIGGDARFVAQPAYAEASRRAMENMNGFAPRQRFLDVVLGTLPMATVVSEWPREMADMVRKAMPWANSDCIGLFGTLNGQHGYLISPGAPGCFRLTRRRRGQLRRLSEHLAAGYWLRALRAPAAPLEHGASAVCAPDGRVLHQDGDLSPELSAPLVAAVRNMDRARCRRRKQTPEEAVELWQALIAGQYTLVESFERNGRRLILVVRCRTPRPALSEREAAVAAAVSRGAANKTIAADLGLATATVGVHLARALRKLGCPSRTALVQWLGASSVGRASRA